MRLLLFAFFLFSAIFTVKAQPPCAGPGRLPNTAHTVCGNLTFNQQFVSPCTGPNLPNPGAGCGDIVSTDNSVWYKFHCYQAGTFGFLLTPGNASDDYDWEIMDVTRHAPGDVYNLELRVSLNLSGQPGPTGCTPAGISDVNCAGGTPGTQFNKILNLVAGHDYLMMVNNWTNSGLGYALDFSGTAVLTPNIPPTITSVSIVGCDPSKLRVTFSEDIICSSITNSASEFGNMIAGQVVTGITSDCSLPGANGVPSLIINLQTPMPPGNYQLNANVGTDGDIFRNVCRLEMQPVSIPFSVSSITPVKISSVGFTGCAPTFLTVMLDKPVWCNSITSTGSEFLIMPGSHPITSVQSSCNTSGTYTNQLQINLQSPIFFGNYQLVVANGTDGNTFIDTCGNAMTATVVPFSIGLPQPPVIQSFGYDECHRNKLVVNFDHPIDCASLTANGSEFSLVPGPAVTGISSSCGSSNLTSQVTLFLQSNMPTQTFFVRIGIGTDGNTLYDTCLAYVPPGFGKLFTPPALPPPPVFTSLQEDDCDPTYVRAFFNHPILCSSILPDGSQFTLSVPPPVNIISATPDPIGCSLGYTNSILLKFSGPITTAGYYRLEVRNIGTPVFDTCDRSQPVFDTMSFYTPGKISAAFNSQVKWGCTKDTILLSHPGGNGTNSWRWNFSDGSTASGQNISKAFPVTTATVDIQLIVSNGSCSDTTMQTITLGNVFNAGFFNAPADNSCINTPVNFTDTSSGNIVNYLWDFGDLTQFNGQNPPPHIYSLSNNYPVQLIVTDIHGCRDTAGKILHVVPSAAIDFTGLKPQYCTGSEVVLTRKISPNIISYVWDNGDGKTFNHEAVVNFSYANEGVYTITLNGIDKYCGSTSVSKTVPVYAVPKVSLGPDTVLCQSDRMLIGVTPNANYTYLWNTGAATSQVYTDLFTRDYTLTADNHGCRGYDAMHIKVLTECLIKVPGAFTPNGDGLNDLLKALNADLAKNFSFRVYNRMGQLIFSTNDPLEGWDGKFRGNPESTGTFVWYLSYTDPWTGKAVKETGTSILLR